MTKLQLMVRLAAIIAIALLLSLSGPVSASQKGLSALKDTDDMEIVLRGVAAKKRGDYVTAFSIFKPYAERGLDFAQVRIGSMYRQGRGVPQDYVEALKWYRMAAAQGCAHAQTMLGGMFGLGQGTAKNYEKARHWYSKAAEQGKAGGMVGLGQLFWFGDGVPKDFVRAHMWFNLAASRVRSKALQRQYAGYRDKLASKMTQAQITEAQKLAREWKPKNK